MRQENKEAAAAATFKEPAMVAWAKKGASRGGEVGHFESYGDCSRTSVALAWAGCLDVAGSRGRAEFKTRISEPLQNYKCCVKMLMILSLNVQEKRLERF